MPARAASVDVKTLVARSRSDCQRATGSIATKRDSGRTSKSRGRSESAQALHALRTDHRLQAIGWSKREMFRGLASGAYERPSGARMLFDSVSRRSRRIGVKGLRRAPAGVGARAGSTRAATPRSRGLPSSSGVTPVSSPVSSASASAGRLRSSSRASSRDASRRRSADATHQSGSVSIPTPSATRVT